MLESVDFNKDGKLQLEGIVNNTLPFATQFKTLFCSIIFFVNVVFFIEFIELMMFLPTKKEESNTSGASST